MAYFALHFGVSRLTNVTIPVAYTQDSLLQHNCSASAFPALDTLGDIPVSLVRKYYMGKCVPTVHPQDIILVLNSLMDKNCNIQEKSVSIHKRNSQNLAIPLSI